MHLNTSVRRYWSKRQCGEVMPNMGKTFWEKVKQMVLSSVEISSEVEARTGLPLV